MKKGIKIFLLIVLIIAMAVLGFFVGKYYQNQNSVALNNTLGETENQTEQATENNEENVQNEVIGIFNSSVNYYRIESSKQEASEPGILNKETVKVNDKLAMKKINEILNSSIENKEPDIMGFETQYILNCYTEEKIYYVIIIDKNTFAVRESFFGGEIRIFNTESNNNLYDLVKDYNEKYKLKDTYYLSHTDGGYGIINQDGEGILPNKYASINIIDNTLDIFECTINNKTYILDKDGDNYFINADNMKTIIGTAGGESYWYEYAFTRTENGKVGLNNIYGNKLLECEYDEIVPLNCLPGYLKLVKDNEVKLIYLVNYASGYRDCGTFKEVGILGIDIEYTDAEQKYMGKNEDLILGIDLNGKRRIIEKEETKVNEDMLSEMSNVEYPEKIGDWNYYVIDNTYVCYQK